MIASDTLQRDQAWDIRAYPCIGIGAWLVPQLCRHPNYPDILKRVTDGGILIDVGTFIGHDLRRLVQDGAPSEKLYGIDIVNTSDVGYAFFRDREHFKGHFIEADFLSTTSAKLTALKGQVDVVVVSQLLHQWNWQGQVDAAKVLTTFTKPGSIIAGNQIGNSKAQEVSLSRIDPTMQFFHQSPKSFAKLWHDVGVATGTTWQSEAWLRSFEELGLVTKDGAWMEPGYCLIEFVAKRVS